ncbi:hypothetical protein HMI55_004798 [Coelomomyces lativittatus]|nr:hypothetical protein HMI55_004798 [Coelomomyces lativittatus]
MGVTTRAYLGQDIQHVIAPGIQDLHGHVWVKAMVVVVMSPSISSSTPPSLTPNVTTSIHLTPSSTLPSKKEKWKLPFQHRAMYLSLRGKKKGGPLVLSRKET